MEDVCGVVLAAGYSGRARVFKMELDLGGRPMLARTLEALSPFCSRLLVVTGFRHERVEALLAPFPQAEAVYNPEFGRGMFSSVRAGVARVAARRFFFTPGDCPAFGSGVCEKLLAVRAEVAVPVFGGRRGHPVLLEGACAAEILREPPDSNLRLYLRKKDCVFVETGNEGILRDVDTMEDYDALRSLYAAGETEKNACGG